MITNRIVPFLFLLFLVGCTLNGEQEKKLNESFSAYIFAKNECQVISYVAFTYPELVASYKAEGDSLFKEHFNCNKDSIYLDDPTLRQTVKEGNSIHVLYDLSLYHEATGKKDDKKYQLIGISEDDGKTWFFMDKTEYVDKSRLPKLVRLLKD